MDTSPQAQPSVVRRALGTSYAALSVAFSVLLGLFAVGLIVAFVRLHQYVLATITVALGLWGLVSSLTPSRPKRQGWMDGYVPSVGTAILFALLLRAFVVEAFKIPSGSMIPTLLVGDHLFVNKFAYGFRIPFTLVKIGAKVPDRGDIIVFNNPKQPDVDFIKRVIGIPGDRIDVRDDTVSVNGVEQKKDLLNPEYTYEDSNERVGEFLSEGREFQETLTRRDGKSVVVHRTIQNRDAFPREEGPFFVEPDHVFVMGDNRDNSSDSRVMGGIGQIPIDYIKGNALVIWLSLGGPNHVRMERMFRTLGTDAPSAGAQRGQP